MNYEHNPGIIIGDEKPAVEGRRVAESQRTIEAQPKLDKNFRQRLGNLFLRAVFGKNGLLDMARQEQQISARPTVEINPAVPIKADTVQWKAAEGVAPIIEPAPLFGEAHRPQAEIQAKATVPQETQPNYSEAQEIKARVGVDIPGGTTTVYKGRLVGEERHDEEPK